MPVQPDPIPEFRKGDLLTAAQLNQIVAAVRAKTPLAPGSFVTGAFSVIRALSGVEEGAASDGTTRYGRVVVGVIPAATNCRAAGWGIAEDAVSILDDVTGEEVDPDHPITVTNRTRQAYTVGCMVELRGSLVINGDCFPAPDEFWNEIES